MQQNIARRPVQKRFDGSSLMRPETTSPFLTEQRETNDSISSLVEPGSMASNVLPIPWARPVPPVGATSVFRDQGRREPLALHTAAAQSAQKEAACSVA